MSVAGTFDFAQRSESSTFAAAGAGRYRSIGSLVARVTTPSPVVSASTWLAVAWAMTLSFTRAAAVLASGAVIDLVDGGGGLDRAVISGNITISAGNSLVRATSVESLRSADDTAVRAHSIEINSDTNLSGVTTIDLSGGRDSGSTSTVNLTGVSIGVTVLGTAASTTSSADRVPTR